MGVSLFSPNAIRQRNEEIVRNGKISAWLDIYHEAAKSGNSERLREASEALAKLKRGEDA